MMETEQSLINVPVRRKLPVTNIDELDEESKGG